MAAKRTAPLITLTTDFGLRDPYVGQVKGVILGLCPGVSLVDLSHDIPPQEVDRAGLVIACSVPYFPPGTIHLAVVDPGVGTSRRAILVQAGGQMFVAPDNGLLTRVLKGDPRAKVREIINPAVLNDRISPTFHGRGRFPPRWRAGWRPVWLRPRWGPGSGTRSCPSRSFPSCAGEPSGAGWSTPTGSETW